MLNNGIDNIKYIITIISSIITIIGVVTMLSMVHWSLPIALFVSMIPGFIGIAISKVISYNNSVDLIKNEREQNYISSLFFNKNSLKEIKIFNTGSHLLNKWTSLFEFIRNSKVKVLKKEKQISILGNLVMQISTVVTSIYLVFNIVNAYITIGDYVALTTAMTTFLASIGSISENIGELFERSLYNSALFEVINEQDSYNSNNMNNYNSINPIETLDLKNITFKYPNTSKNVLKGLSLTIKKGEKIALVGNNGSGKSTLINILSGIYTDYAGSFKVNGFDVKNGLLKKYQEKITVVLQDFNKYKFSIKDNIAFGNVSKQNNSQFIKNKLKQVDLYDYVEKLPNNIDTLLSKEFENGTELSGGQWQKIAIARAIAKSFDIIIFDEPTSALDPLAEMEVFNLLTKLSSDKTAIMISHRLGITKYADKIYFMENGRIIEKGTHNELIELDGKYKKMYDSQAKWYK